MRRSVQRLLSRGAGDLRRCADPRHEDRIAAQLDVRQQGSVQHGIAARGLPRLDVEHRQLRSGPDRELQRDGVFPRIRLGIPFTDITLWSEPTNRAIGPLTAAILGLGLNEGAYVAEIVRAGIISVGRGQTDAAAALGMRRSAVMRRVVLPQAVPVVIPPMGNEFIGMLKYSALASVIAVEELLGSVERIYSTNLRTLELLVVASIWYLACTTALTIGQHYLERYAGRSRGAAQAAARWRIWSLRRTAH